MREQKVAGSGDVLMRSDFMNNGLDVLEDVFYLARPLRTGSSNEPTGFVASAVVVSRVIESFSVTLIPFATHRRIDQVLTMPEQP